MRGLQTTRQDVLNMPTYERRYYLSLLRNEKESNDEQRQEQNSVIQTGRGSRIRKVGGNALKNMFKNGQIPNT